MTLRAKYTLYLSAIHAVFLGACLVCFWKDRIWLIALEVFFGISLAFGLVLVHRLFEPVRLIRSGIDLIEANEFATRFLPVGQPDLDPLIQVYNRMADGLRVERIRNEEQERFLQQIVAASPSGMVVMDLDGRVAMANRSACELLRRGEADLVGQRLEEVGTLFASQLAALGENDVKLVPLEGPRRVKCQALQFMDRGFPRRFLLMEELTGELHRSERAAYDKLIRVISHEVNNTAGAVISLLDSCQRYAVQVGEPDREDYAQALGVASRRIGKLNRFIEEFADVVRLPDPRKRPCDLKALLAEIATLLERDSARRGIRWRWEVDADVPPVSADPGQMEQVFLNVLKNAVEAAGEGGAVAVILGLEGGRPILSVRDSGPGITQEVREELFTTFFTTKRDGKGIGLTVVREVLTRHGFEYSLENLDGGGAEFKIRF